MNSPHQSRRGYTLSICILGLMTAIAPLSIDTYLPALPGLAQQFQANPVDVQYTLSLFFVGLGVGPLLYGPLSDRYGRQPILYFGLVLYLLASIACATSTSIAMLVGARLLQGLGASVGPAMARAIVRDRYHGSQAASMMSFVVMVMGVAPLIAPMIGSLMLSVAEWPLIFWMLSFYAMVALAALAVLLPESHPRHLQNRTRSLAAQYLDYLSLLRRLPVILHLICGALMFGVLFSYVAAGAFIYTNEYSIGQSAVGFYFSINAASMVIGTFTNGRIVERFGHRALLGIAVANTLVWALLLLATSLTGFAGFWGMAIPLFFLLSTIGVAGANTIAGLLDLAPKAAGAASALFGVCQFACAALATWVLGMLGGDALAMAQVMIVCAAGALIAYLSIHRWAPLPGEGF
ncbi:multidrug effflux MFS transporter [Chromohalobacter sp. 48-RD10]|uniref:multidrug effflux MFS transporter n=1 Tax=Chromohalobacter sp. 48-RD10 TaxID=2994063 RepID=UPI0024697EF7|nr:multidrug effflux MFS transporter [Chromohalobacter sp. 48-RD10]